MCVFDSFGDGELEHERVHRVTPGIELERRARRRETPGDVPKDPPRFHVCSIVRASCKTRARPWWTIVLIGVFKSPTRRRGILIFISRRCGGADWSFGTGAVSLRLAFLLTASAAFAVSFAFSHYCLPKKWGCERKCVELYAAAFVVSWTGVIKYHGPRPSRRGNRGGVVYVSNHTSMIDYLVLTQVSPFAVIQQKHKGWVGLLQRTAMSAIDCIEFNRTDIKDRHKVSSD